MALQQMQHISSYNNSITCSMQISLHQKLNSMGLTSYNDEPDQSIMSKDQIKAYKHKKAESKRRGRINDQYVILRDNFPNLIKRNKASVLEEVIRQVKQLTNTLSELKKNYRGGRMECVFPGGEDRVSVEFCTGQGRRGLVKVKFNCVDRRRLMSDVERAVKSVNGKVVRAEMVTMGGRTMCVLWVQGINSKQDLQLLRNEVKAVTDTPKASRTFNRPQLTL